MSTIEKALAKQKQKQSTTNVSSNQASPLVDEIKVHNNLQPTSQTSTNNKPVLQLDKKSLSERGYLIDNTQHKSIKSEFRRIKRPLLQNAFGAAAKTLKNSNLVMVSSSKPHEGKTFVAINLAMSIALEQDKTVLLVDADVLRPSVIRELGVQKTSGLIEYLLDTTNNISDIIYNTDVNNLKLIPAGKPHHLSNELLASEKMATLAQELASRYPDRIVIFDCPPLIGVTETLVLAHLMGQAIIVVEESKTKINDVLTATSSLNENLAVGLVVNKSIRTHKDLYGYYGYGYDAED